MSKYPKTFSKYLEKSSKADFESLRPKFSSAGDEKYVQAVSSIGHFGNWLLQCLVTWNTLIKWKTAEVDYFVAQNDKTEYSVKENSEEKLENSQKKL